jgi:uncharacterized protein YlzI (FlbEa/FlbD family)
VTRLVYFKTANRLRPLRAVNPGFIREVAQSTRNRTVLVFSNGQRITVAEDQHAVVSRLRRDSRYDDTDNEADAAKARGA